MSVLRKFPFKRRRIFPVLMLGALAVSAFLAGRANEPTQQFEYLNELIPQTVGVFASEWTDAGVGNAEKLAKADKDTLMGLIESADFGQPQDMTRSVYLGQAQHSLSLNSCSSDAPKCKMSVILNREVSPTYVHGDLRIVSLEEKSMRRDYEVDRSKGAIQINGVYEQTRQMRFKLTQRGWVQTTSEILSENSASFSSSAEIINTKYAGLNYYPHTAPWDKFWTEFPGEEIQTDLDFMQSLGANSIRIFVNHAYFTDGATRDDGLAKLDTFLNWSAARKIKVIVTMFDLRADYRFTNWSLDSAHVRSVVDKIGNHEALLAIDLKNQADLDFENAGQPQVEAWLSAMMDSVRSENSSVPLTIGWSDAEHATLLAQHVDMISYHDYRSVKGTDNRLAQVKAKVTSMAGDKPVFLTEIGNSRWSPIGENSKKQGRRLDTRLKQLADADGVFVWTLHDFEHVGTNIVGHRPWRRAQQKLFGIANKDNSLLPSGEAYKTFTTQFLNQNLETE